MKKITNFKNQIGKFLKPQVLKITNMWKSSILLNNQWFKKDMKKEIRKYLEINKNKNTIYQTTWDTAKAAKPKF